MSEPLTKVCELLRRRRRPDLASLLAGASVEFDWADDEPYSRDAFAVIRAPVEHFDQLENLPEGDAKEVTVAVIDVYPPRDIGMVITRVSYLLDTASLHAEQDSPMALRRDIDAIRSVMLNVATNQRLIDDANPEYRELYRRIDDALRELGMGNPNPYEDLWAWYGKWKTDLRTYQSRRDHVRELYTPLEEQLRRRDTGLAARVLAEPTGWPRVDRQLREIARRLKEASLEEQFQGVGHLCREALISLAQTVHDPTRHPPTDGILPSEADAKRMLDAYLAVEFHGQARDAARKLAKASLDLANAVQHKRDAEFRDAAFCVAGTRAVVDIIAIACGRHDPR